ncbi:nucleoid-associated protein, YbaB/EbfC family [Helicobacter sp. 13S00401-1]|uniref:YbaB/EbfC family nucleoid-associated protein n=1 Tax=Helicobacter sp. 13S00401-1 TaxID=1905758 RepID=UPI000BA6E87E|nr:YbaB/EbfC family nucleoid-associated protein [Helicobacter sp. 13S00401-1]PAF50953.1 nucleoid-associated protein, YbaB/EbfC family [Helicobacter sp. 13S00401-1]
MLDPKMLETLMGSIEEQLEGFKNEGKDKIFSVKSGGGLVEVKINGSGEVIDLIIDDELLEDKSSLQVLLISAINEANKEADNFKKESAMTKMKDLNPFK